MSGILAEVRAFVAALRGEHPEVFSRPAPRGSDPFSERCAHHAPAMGVEFGKVRLKEMSSLWGSCSARGDLSFNRRLLDAPPEVLDYVVVHELAHLRWRGHGKRFWDLVARHCPEQRRRRRWLRDNGRALLAGQLPGAGAVEREDAQGPLGAGRQEILGQGEVEAPGLGVGPAAV